MSVDPPITSPTTPEELQHAVRGGTRAVAIAQIFSQVITIGTLAVLLRLISPAAYGLLAMVLPVLFFLRIFTKLGLNIATVQRPDIAAAEISTLFWLNMALGSATALATAFLAPVLAWFYNEPAVTELTVLLAGTSIAVAFGAQHQALLERRMHLGRLAACRVTAQLCASVLAIAAALYGWNVWALVVQQYAEAVLGSLFAWLAEPWRPTRPDRDVPLRGYLAFGGYYSASSILFFLSGNLDKVLVGRWMGEYSLGLYSQAFNLMLKPVSLVTEPLTSVMLSALSRSANDPAGRMQMLVGFYRVVGITLMPAGVGLSLVGDQVLYVLGGERWAMAGPIEAVLGLAVVGQGFINIAGPVFTAAGRTDRMFFGALVLLVILTQGYVIGWWIGERFGSGLLGVAWGYTLALLVVLVVPYTIYCLRASGYRSGPVFAALVRPAVAAVAMGAIVWSVRGQLGSLPVGVQLLLEIVVGVASYIVLAGPEIRWLLREVRTLRQSEEA